MERKENSDIPFKQIKKVINRTTNESQTTTMQPTATATTATAAAAPADAVMINSNNDHIQDTDQNTGVKHTLPFTIFVERPIEVTLNADGKWYCPGCDHPGYDNYDSLRKHAERNTCHLTEEEKLAYEAG